ncbi:MAG: hypothetical protein ACHQIM_15235 [Sphingobacteriales bacterium]
MSDIKLNFINNSNDANNSEIIIFQKNEAFTDAPAVAWKVIKSCGQGCNHPFIFPAGVTVSASDSNSNYFPEMPATGGQVFQAVLTPSGDTLEMTSIATQPGEIDIVNASASDAINAKVYRNGRLLATKTRVLPGQKAVFVFQPTLWIGAVSQIQQGQIMDFFIESQINTQISLIGIESADIVMTGGGPGQSSTPFVFTLENVVYV